jgi:RNA polymerase sigma factor (TIGR02999 family)
LAQPLELTETLLRARLGDHAALEELVPTVYDEMRRLAASYLRAERPGHTLQATALAHEAYLKLVDQSRVDWQGRAHFLGIAAQAMRRILADHARRRRAAKRGGDPMRVALELVDLENPGNGGVAVDDLDAALEDLARLDPRQARVVELRFFGGLSIEETAEVTGVSPATVKRDWVLARAWLHRELKGGEA